MEALILLLSRINKHTLPVGIYQLCYGAWGFSLTQVSLYKDSQYFC